MVTLFITSMGEAAGKSAVCASLFMKLQAKGKKAGFIKPVCIGPKGGDKDAGVMKRILGLQEPDELICPVAIDARNLAAAAGEKEPSWLKQVKEAHARVSQGKDVVIMEGVGGFRAGSDSARIAGRIVDALKARAILLVGYEPDLEADQIVAAAKMLADNLAGVVFNAVPQSRMESVKAQFVPALTKSGVKVLGILPEDRALFAITVGELADYVGGDILNSKDHAGELVESMMVGAMSLDSALTYLKLKENKAVITRGDRPDIQLAALATSTKCLVLTGNINPAPGILSRALELEIPIVLVKKDTVSTMQALDGVFDKAVFHHPKKLERIGQILESNLDLKAIYQGV